MAIKNLILARGRLGGVNFIPTTGLSIGTAPETTNSPSVGFTGKGRGQWTGNQKARWTSGNGIANWVAKNQR